MHYGQVLPIVEIVHLVGTSPDFGGLKILRL